MSKIIPFPKKRDGAKWFDIKNATADSADIYLYDEIGGYFSGTDAASVIEQIRNLNVKTLNVRINSPGGSVFDGMAIYNALARHSAEVITHIDGIAASIASVIALAGKRVLIAENAMMMIHDPSALVWGDAAELRKQADVLDQIKETIITTYVTRTGLPRDDVAEMMSEETWFTADEAVEKKFADESVSGVKAAACFDLTHFGYAKADAITVALKASAAPAFNPALHAIRKKKLELLER
jgi:ATP-dependent Clp endopeptidase proteolytic subunit ClpP